MTTAEIRRQRSLAEGMTIAASIRARLLRVRILELDADIAIAPIFSSREATRAHLAGAPEGPWTSPSSGPAPPSRLTATGHAHVGTSNGTIGSSLGAVARSLEASTAELAAARRRMP